MKKGILILICLLFLTGCDATYELTINNDEVKEKIKIIETNTQIFDVVNDSGWTLRQQFDSFLNDDEFSNETYSIKSLNKKNQLGIQLKSKRTENLLSSIVLNQCYNNPVVELNGDIVTIKTGSNFECFDYYQNLNTIQVKFKTNHKVISTNCDEKKGNYYIWNITKNSNKNIEISYYDSIVYDIYRPLYITIGVIVLGIVLIAIYFLISKNKKENSI